VTVERLAGIVAFALVAAGLLIGFVSIGPPQHMRLVALDRRRVDDLQSIERELRGAEERRHGEAPPLPARGRDSWPRDPLTGAPYEYRRDGATRYRLCATFALASTAEDPHWNHPAGRACYRLADDD
jgi:hypothetical protein